MGRGNEPRRSVPDRADRAAARRSCPREPRTAGKAGSPARMGRALEDGPTRSGMFLAGYGSRVLRVHALLSLILAALATGVGVWLVWGSHAPLAHPMGVAFLSLAFSIPFLLLVWLARRLAYLHLAPQHAVVHSAVYAVLL